MEAQASTACEGKASQMTLWVLLIIIGVVLLICANFFVGQYPLKRALMGIGAVCLAIGLILLILGLTVWATPGTCTWNCPANVR